MTPSSSTPRSDSARSRGRAVIRGLRSRGDSEGVAFLRDRLALFGQVAFWLDLGFLVVSIAAVVVTGTLSLPDAMLHAGHAFQMVTVALLAMVWGACRWLSLGRGALLAIDAATTILVSLVFCISAMARPDGASVHPTVLALTNVLLARAVLVPSSVARTLSISLAAGVPVMLVGLAQSHAMLQSMSLPGHHPEVQATFVILWVLLACAVATVASHVIFGLRREVAEARRFGQYALEEKISEGGMGEVWRARHALLRRPTAIKLLRPDRSDRAGDARFEREVRLTARLTHPNTISIWDYGRTDEGIFYYAMELLEGVTLHELVLHDGPQPAGRIIHVLRQACGSLAEAHDNGLIHRDVKPSNVILCERGSMVDVAKVFDFGLVKDIGSDAEDEGGLADMSISGTNTIAGTPRHMAPEAISSPSSVGPSVDIYGLGTVAYWLCTGEHVFDGGNFVQLCAQHLSSRPDPPSARPGNTAPPDLEAIIMRCLEKHPSLRWASVRELDAALAACRDAGSWTEPQARDWWSERMPAIRAGRRADPAAASGGSRDEAPTLSVLAARGASDD